MKTSQRKTAKSKTRKKKIKQRQKQIKHALTLLKNILQSGGIIGLGIKPMQTNIYTKLAGELDTIEADAYNSDEYWILRALTNGLSNPSSYINSRDKTFFKIRNILENETSASFNDILEELLIDWKNNINNEDIDEWRRWIAESKVKWEQMKGQTKNNITFEDYLKYKTGIDNIDTLWERVEQGYYCQPGNLLKILENWNYMQDQTPMLLIRESDEAEKAEKFMDELEKGLGMRRGPQPRDLSPSRNQTRSRSRSRSRSASSSPDINTEFNKIDTLGYRYPQCRPLSGQWDESIKNLAEEFVDNISITNILLFNEILGPTSNGGKKKKKTKKKAKKSKKRR